MNPLTLADFEGYFRELHGRAHYDWQYRLAERVTEKAWPGAVDLPTGSGKTSCLDIAVFALATRKRLLVMLAAVIAGATIKGFINGEAWTV